ncbi:hypothetical protein PHYPSEUDO_004758 [Phytophthora pseudosyringae]|uniref:FYVE-type domain-containing protein n=1 Tax=Phytophthora pseudosyringae TaxID=221518 RepID=A0A8T1VQV8_9STRA|nr:hypothetical protein PHYPSEUDO_004758 [Phytophthora pseudosyringae]
MMPSAPKRGGASDPVRFTPVQLYENEREDLIKLAHEQYKALFRNVRLAQANGFATRVSAFARTTRATVCADAKIRATLPELVGVFLGERTNAAIGFAQSQQIYRFLVPTAEHPFRSCGMRWSLWHSPSKLIRQRDIVYLEYTDTFVDERGRRGWARMTQSLEHRSCPPLVGSHNIVRAFLHCCGTVYTETDDAAVLDATTYYDADTQGVPPWMTKIVANRKAKNPHNLEHLIRLEHVLKDGMDPDSSVQETHVNAKLCVGCNDVLPKWGRHRKCRDCSEFICKSCSDVVYCAIQGRKKLNRICVHCVDDFLARTNRQLELTVPSSVSFNADDVSSPGGFSGRFLSADSVEASTTASTTRSNRGETSLRSSYSSTAGSEGSQPQAIEDSIQKELASRGVAAPGRGRKTRSRHAMSEGASTPAAVDLSYLNNV